MPANLPEIKFQKYVLPNGLNVILHEDHSIPMVAVNVWYHVGSKNEKPGRTGFAHLFEHMMFQGSQHHDEEYFTPLQKVGAAINGSTSEDRTNYWENVPSNQLELALWLESDRMGFLLPAMTQKKLDNQRDVVKNERRQMLENQPYAKAFDLLPSLMFSDDHPYSWPVIGSMADLSAATIEDISEFFKTYYAPNNASLAIAGDFDPAEAEALVEKYFAAIPPGPPVDRLHVWVPRLETVKRAVQEDQVHFPKAFIAWHTPACYRPGDAELDLFANVLASGKTSRLYRSLVYEQQIAQDVSAFQYSQELSSLFMIDVTARQGHTLEELEKAVDSELKKLLEGGITADELAHAKNAYEADFTRSLEVIGGFGGRADRLNQYNVYLGDPGKFEWDMNRYLKATAADVLQVAREYLDFNRRVILHVVPQGPLNAVETEVDRTTMPRGGPEPAFTPPQIQHSRLSNGLDLMLVEDHRLPLLQINLVIKSGYAADPANRPGAASLTAELLDEGTTSRSALQISEEAKGLGAILHSGSSFDGSVVELNVLKKNLEPALALWADVIQNPTFPKEELERQRQIYLGEIQQEATDPGISARKVFLRRLYGAEHPYGQPFTGTGTAESIQAIQREDLLSFYRAHYLPNNAAVVVAGDISMEGLKAHLEKALKGWKPGEVKRHEIPVPSALEKLKFVLVDKPNAPQSMIVAGGLGLKRSDPDYTSAVVLNAALGGKFTSRLNMNLREDKGYSYGVRTVFSDTRGIGPFLAIAPVQSMSTKESILEILKELRDISESRPITEEELIDAKDNIVKGFPQQFQTLSGITNRMMEIVLYDLPVDDWQNFLRRVAEVTTGAATQAALNHLQTDRMLITVVGDVKQIEPDIRLLNLGDIDYADAEKL